MQDTIVEENADVEYVITDKNVHITAGKSLSGNDSYQVFVSKHQTV
jgi:glucose-1-phosphate adenylyltransferase